MLWCRSSVAVLLAPGLLALAIIMLAGCAARAPESRPPSPPAEDVSKSPPVRASALDPQPTSVDAAVPTPGYPPQALAAHAQGSVVLHILIDETGRVRDAKVLSEPGHGLGEAAMRTARHFRFKPMQLRGEPVVRWWTFTVKYELPRVGAAVAPACVSKNPLVCKLGADLAGVRAAPADHHLEVWGLGDLGPLRGTPLAEIRAALGKPDCESASGNPCTEGADLVYDGWWAGGPNLLIWADAGADCREAIWRGTK
jgi:TonB family protein